MTALSTNLRSLGRSSLKVSPLAWGMWRFQGDDVAHAQSLVEAAFAAGITLFDTADIYGLGGADGFGGAERLLGKVFAAAPHLRQRMVLATKGGIEPGTPYNSSPAYLIEACEASLKRLNTDHVELYQIHRPDLLAHPEQVAETFYRLRKAGKILEAGVSNFTTSQTRALQAWLDFPLAATQPEFSALHIEPLTDGVLDLAQETRLSVLAWSPLAGGRLMAPPADQPRVQRVAEALDAVAAQQGATRDAVAIAWVLAHPTGAIPIIGSQSPARIQAAAKALDIQLSRAEWYAILTASRGERLP
jgi:predicted oxidoreductase